MTVYPGGMPQRRHRLEGPDRALDALVGLVLLIAELLIGVLAASALYSYGVSMGSDVPDGAQVGFGIAVFGGGVFVIITTIAYLIRVVVGRRSWTAPAWGLALMSLSLLIGWMIMASGI